MVTASALMVTLFFGGWDIPGQWDTAPWSAWKTIATALFFLFKTGFFVFFYMWIRWTLPRFRYDQLMALGWKFMLPLSLGYIVVMASAILGLDAAGLARGSWGFGLSLLAINVVLVGILFFVIDRGRIISPAYSRLDKRNVDKLRAIAARSKLMPEGRN
jgi:NADH-quinone oxidoreductase subunit H